MFTREDYMHNRCTHEQYYGQFVTPQLRALVLATFGHVQLCTAYESDKHFNTIDLNAWDMLTYHVHVDYVGTGDYPTLAGKVCTLKEAARQIVEASKEKMYAVYQGDTLLGESDDRKEALLLYVAHELDNTVTELRQKGVGVIVDNTELLKYSS